MCGGLQSVWHAWGARQSCCTRKSVFCGIEASILFQKTKDPNLGIQLTEEPQKQCDVCGGLNTDVQGADSHASLCPYYQGRLGHSETITG